MDLNLGYRLKRHPCPWSAVLNIGLQVERRRRIFKNGSFMFIGIFLFLLEVFIEKFSVGRSLSDSGIRENKMVRRVARDYLYYGNVVIWF